MLQTRQIQNRSVVRAPFFAAAVLTAGLMSCKRETPDEYRYAPNTPVSRSTVAVTASAPASRKKPPTKKPPQPVKAEYSSKDKMVQIDGFSIDQFEAVLINVAANGAEILHPYYNHPESEDLVAVSLRGMRPQSYLDRGQADRFCKNAGKRLCTTKEWRRACMGKSNRLFSYSQKSDPAACNLGGPHHLSEFFGTNNKNWTYENFNDPRLSQRPGFLAKTGSHMECRSDEGVYDMLGNVQEWVSETVKGRGTFVGGFYSNPVELVERRASGEGCTYILSGPHMPAYRDYSIGFRCCKD
ncbi:MAG: SUMF1/EgtB/PvdO family nonheme iron enzyme [Candidatus Micrarchaeota archaeon]